MGRIVSLTSATGRLRRKRSACLEDPWGWRVTGPTDPQAAARYRCKRVAKSALDEIKSLHQLDAPHPPPPLGRQRDEVHRRGKKQPMRTGTGHPKPDSGTGGRKYVVGCGIKTLFARTAVVTLSACTRKQAAPVAASDENDTPPVESRIPPASSWAPHARRPQWSRSSPKAVSEPPALLGRGPDGVLTRGQG